MYACMYVCACVHIIHTYTHIRTQVPHHVQGPRTKTQTHHQILACTCTFAVYLCAYIYIYIYIHTHIHIHAHTHTSTHTHAHTSSRAGPAHENANTPPGLSMRITSFKHDFGSGTMCRRRLLITASHESVWMYRRSLQSAHVNSTFFSPFERRVWRALRTMSLDTSLCVCMCVCM